jgi:hypothetical protein
MAKAMSPRTPAPKLRSTVKAEWGTPRRTQSVFQTVAVARGFTVKAGAVRRANLKKGIPAK